MGALASLGATDPHVRAAAAASCGLGGSLPRGSVGLLGTLAARDPDARVRSSALGALVRAGAPTTARRVWSGARRDAESSVRRRAAELAPRLVDPPLRPLLELLADDDPLVAEGAACAIGEIAWAGSRRARAVRTLAHVTTEHSEAVVREAAVAALGAIGDTDGLAAVIEACGDRPAVRRRAVLALAPFDGPDVDAALARALDDRDWQVRQAAEDLTELL